MGIATGLSLFCFRKTRPSSFKKKKQKKKKTKKKKVAQNETHTSW